MSAEDFLFEWREQVGIRIMHALHCKHSAADFGPRAVCGSCFEDTQRIGALVQGAAEQAWWQGCMAWAERVDDPSLGPPDNPYRGTP